MASDEHCIIQMEKIRDNSPRSRRGLSQRKRKLKRQDDNSEREREKERKSECIDVSVWESK